MALAIQLTIQMNNERGALATLCTEFAKVAVNITGLHLPEQAGEALVRIVATPVDSAKKVLENLSLPYREEIVLTVHLHDRPGALGKITRKLAEKGIDILYAYGTIEPGSERAVVIMGVSDSQTASEFVK
ncbi:MAG: ACT domain-containing protein [Acidobacteria bacterium]|nr:ACT domain-containing protein [Acidobacteriota bacterium]